jgi:hypothetical protein
MSSRRWRAALWLGLAALAALAIALAVVESQRPPVGPAPVAWSKVTCARCRMLVSEPGFAAQLQTVDGSVLFFDDPGDLLLYQAEEQPEVHAIYFHHHAEDRWIPGDRVRFVPVAPTPMGHGLGATDADLPGALDYPEARAMLLDRESERQRNGGPR